VGVGMVAGGGPMARLPQLIGRNRALEVLLGSEDIRGEQPMRALRRSADRPPRMGSKWRFR
jgi:enoyl-CoA hydratase/carnithine racemase